MKRKRFACRALLSGKDVYTAQFFGLVVVLEGQGFYIKKEHFDGLAKVFVDEKIELFGHDLKQLVKVLGG